MFQPTSRCSREFKACFVKHFQRWSIDNNLGMADLAIRCGVSTEYIRQILRNGRVPGKPVLLLLTLNFGLAQSEELFVAAGLLGEHPVVIQSKQIDPNGIYLNGEVSFNGESAQKNTPVETV